MDRRMDGRRDGYLYIYCLPPAGGRYAPKVINAPTAQSWMGGGMVGGIANDMYNNDVGKGVVYAYEAYEAK